MSLPNIDSYITRRAHATNLWKFFEELIGAGFTSEQALKILCAFIRE